MLEVAFVMECCHCVRICVYVRVCVCVCVCVLICLAVSFYLVACDGTLPDLSPAGVRAAAPARAPCTMVLVPGV